MSPDKDGVWWSNFGLYSLLWGQEHVLLQTGRVAAESGGWLLTSSSYTRSARVAAQGAGAYASGMCVRGQSVRVT